MVVRQLAALNKEVKRLKESVFTKGSFAQNFAFTFSGNAIGIIIQLVFAPLLSRIYGPEAYGVFSVFNALATNMATVATLRLEGAIVLPHKEDEAHQVIRATTGIAVMCTAGILMATLLGGNQLAAVLGLKGSGNLLYALAPYVLLQCVAQISAGWVVRKKAFKEALIFGTPVTIITKIFNLVYGIATKGAFTGLVLTEALTKLIGAAIRLHYIIRINPAFFSKALSFASIRKVILKYRQFPLFDLPGAWVNMLSSQLPVYMLSASFGAGPVGQLGFAGSLLDMPMRLLGNAVSPVFLQKAAQTYSEHPGELGRITVDLYKRLLLLGLVPFTVLTVFGDMIFSLVFGPEWKQAGVFTGYLGFFYLFRLISSPLSSVFTVTGKQAVYFRFQIILLTGRALTLFIGFYWLRNIEKGILLFGIFNALIYLFLSVWILYFVNAKVIRLTLTTLFWIASCFILLQSIKTVIKNCI